MLKVVVLMLFVAANATDAASLMAPSRIMKRGDTIRVCGPMLVDTLSILCNGEYYDPSESSSSGTGKRSYIPQSVPMEPYLRWLEPITPSRGQQKEQGHGNQEIPNPRKRHPRGVVDECCWNACSIATLLSYCRPSTVESVA